VLSLKFQIEIKNKYWLLLCVIISSVFIIVGTIAIESVYKSPFPIKSEVNEQDSYLKVMKFYCVSDKIYPIVGRDLICCVHVEDTSKNQFKKHIPTGMYVGEHKFGENYSETFKPLQFRITEETISENEEKICSSSIRINQYGENALSLGLITYETESNKENIIFFGEINFFAYSIGEYDNKVNQKLSLYFLLVPLGIFSVSSFIKNMLDIINYQGYGKGSVLKQRKRTSRIKALEKSDKELDEK